ncbi:hypothetical protein [Streptomyces ardesiacus]|uniref:hypothetical protein n=1 Tax=Streptomyces ardesiacus TaxID=285564 RepID=UPI0033FEBB1E
MKTDPGDGSAKPCGIQAARQGRFAYGSENVTAGDVYDPEGVFDDNFALTPAANHPGGSTP